jgi:aspartate aminotransferase
LSLPGERIGYLVIPDEVVDAKMLQSAAGVTTRILGFVNAPTLMQRVVARCLDVEVNVAAYDKNRKALYDGLTELGFECIKPQGAFYLWVKAPNKDEEKLVMTAKSHNILVVPGSSFALRACNTYLALSFRNSYVLTALFTSVNVVCLSFLES